jgi:ABC-2 type transport system permease protein
MSPRRTFGTARRVLQQLSHDHRTVALILIVPMVLLTLLRFVFDTQIMVFHATAPLILGIFPILIMFLVTSISMLRERRSGTLDRLLTMPIVKGELIVGYALAFTVLAAVQGSLISLVMIYLLDVPVAGGAALITCGAILAALLGMAMGLFTSAFARTEFQAVQFMPVFILPQLLVCGLLVPREQMAGWLQAFADVLPMTYSVDAMQTIARTPGFSGELAKDFVIIGVWIIAALALGAATIRRQD